MTGWEHKLTARIWAHKRWVNSKIHFAVDAHVMAVPNLITSGTVADCKQACNLIERSDSECLLADKGYDNDAFVKKVEES